ncbi:SDR family NAD(P)-dependent oxidoreductase [Kineothrix sp. MB12-C1]|uniref:SDR family NAD(P)-dependent oxidoreductase n=1 Tax=Kineothrix sp. MB12-C1 TaxID=3070215 RepID=UPI0027D2481D|nr:SDR family NAD(P)-dependent oxidoreductase [Kineothrix sp. MB12-C1]WMC92822.1 SDR family NAD(P)-dependent oxidoreductase [Kineothrix sp. MB12-C1]
MKRKNIAIITGASSGLGLEFALQMDKIFHKMDEIWLIARRKERMTELAKLIEMPTKVIAMDVTDVNDMRAFGKILEIEDVTIRMLVNSAGFGLMGAFDSLSIEEQLDMLDVNCKALTRMTYYCIPYMQKNSRILQIASSAGFLPQKNFAVYAASKSYVLSFSRALREELRGRNIWVTAVCPGPVDTEFFDVAERSGSTLGLKKWTMVDVERVVREALLDSYDKKAISVCSLPIKSFHVMAKVIPHSWLLGIMNLLK